MYKQINIYLKKKIIINTFVLLVVLFRINLLWWVETLLSSYNIFVYLHFMYILHIIFLFPSSEWEVVWPYNIERPRSKQKIILNRNIRIIIMILNVVSIARFK